ncbi:MAG: glycosyltransferase family 2 protein [Candidatus Eisenbacteria bacterium]|uniref:Glycosyltransferase family 2 protein n=1 Tax=Eiseniibacteriota bacterium TaxID=2212470 RepID=A0A948RRM3_UNCEI|nr:glycosyltransferase family 2 protein [Candidatus Eisenbacteria bacterium]MBU1949490.1 glycosyltransferase family 2 protein [Candidatus Eisenbacteria bacterium]MBU2689720.1 glycosyltransferase family 2 protein [Candidatus Eisenbacteria bacterium]
METTDIKSSDSLSLFFPVYGDWGTIASMIVLADRIARDLTDDYEILAINDASPDHSDLILAELTQKYSRLRVITHPKNKGYGGAICSGFKNASKTFIFYTDGDAQYDVRELAKLWKARGGADLVNGYKIRRNDPFHRKIVGWSYHNFVKMMFRLKIRDVDCDFRLIRREIFQGFGLTENSGLICVELMTKIHRTGCQIREVPVHHHHRMHGRSQFFNIRRVARVLIDMMGLWWRVFIRKDLGPPGTFPEEPELKR